MTEEQKQAGADALIKLENSFPGFALWRQCANGQRGVDGDEVFRAGSSAKRHER